MSQPIRFTPEENKVYSEADIAHWKVVFAEREPVTNPKHLVGQEIASATVFNQPEADAAHAQEYLAKISAFDKAKFDADHAQAVADQAAREAEQQASIAAAEAAK